MAPRATRTSATIESGLKGSLWKAPSLGWAFSLMAGMSIGIAQGALERFLERSANRPIRGTTYKNQLEAPLTHLMLAEVHSKIQSATLMARANADETDRLGRLAGFRRRRGRFRFLCGMVRFFHSLDFH